MPNPVFHFFDFRLDPARRELVKDGALVELSSRAFDCLVYLVQHRDRAVGRDELISAVWGRADVSDNMLSQTLLRIRRALGETQSEQSAIRTVTKFGYRWVAPTQDLGVPEGTSGMPDPTPAAPSHAFAGVRSEAMEGFDTEAAPTADSDATVAAASPPAPEPGPIARPAAPARQRRYTRATEVALALLLSFAIALVLILLREPPGNAADAAADEDWHTLALVLPVDVRADSSWEWLRYGLMDLIAKRLRDGGVSTLDSRNLYTLVGSNADVGRAQPDAELGLPALSRQRIYVRATRDGEQWRVQLVSVEANRRLEASAQATDVSVSAREAVDRLLAALGKVPPSRSGASGSAQELLERIEATLLTARLDSALDLIAQAPPAIRADPYVQLRQAQIELSAGQIEPARTQATALLAQFAAQGRELERVRTLNVLAGTHVYGSDAAAAAPLLDEAERASTRLGSTADAAATQELRGLMLLQRGAYDSAFAQFAKARLLYGAAGDPLRVAILDVTVGGALSDTARYAEAIGHYTRAEATFEAFGARDRLAFARASHVMSQLELLDNTGALKLSATYWPPEANANNDRTLYFLIRSRALALAHAGRLNEADALLARIAAQASGTFNARVRLNAALAGVDVALLRGAWDQAIARARPLLAAPLADTNDVDVHAGAWDGLIDALRAKGEHAAASAETTRFAAWVEQVSGVNGEHAPATAAQRRDLAFSLALQQANDECAAGRTAAALPRYAALLVQAQALNVPARTVRVARAYVPALLAAGQIDTASAVAGSVALYVDADTDAAWVQAQVYRALGQNDAYQTTLKRLRALAGERQLPPDAANG